MLDKDELQEALGGEEPTFDQKWGDIADEISKKVQAVLHDNFGNKLTNELCIGMHGVIRHQVSAIIDANKVLFEEKANAEN